MKKTLCFVAFLVITFSGFAAPAKKSQKFEMNDGDRVAFIGGVFMEREQDEGHIEAMLTMAFPDRNVTFRNLGWGGDSVESHLAPLVPARPKYVPGLFQYVEQWKPTVILVSFGMMESFRGEDGLGDFIRQYAALLDRLSATTPRIVLISPHRHEALGGQWPDPAAHNRNLKKYTAAIEGLARERGLVFVNLFERRKVVPEAIEPVTSNGVHLNSQGYRQAAAAIQKSLGLTPFMALPKLYLQRAEVLR